ncbi:MAG: NAD(P)-dependent oxidoreductase [Bacteroidales bacterium]|nr:NAD(P)-dependent oxidoreductase [Bacteroidales bacterium]
MNVLLTGSNGFIGNHVAKYLKGHGHYVIGLGRKEMALDPFAINEYIQCNIASEKVKDIPTLISAKIDAVIHLAADMRKEPHLTDVITANCVGTQRLLELCEKQNIHVFLQLSSLPVIGKPLYHPITEEHPIHPYTVYHITKRTEELLANYAAEYHGIRTASFRISAPIGIGVNMNTIFPTFIRKALKDEDLLLFGKGSRKQNYLYVNDISRCLELALTNDYVKGVYNLTSDLLVSNLDLAKTIVKVLNSKSKIILTGEDPTDEYIWDASLEKLKSDSGFVPEGNIVDIINEYASWVKARNNDDFK